MIREIKTTRWFILANEVVIRLDCFRKEARGVDPSIMWSAIPKVKGIECEASVGPTLREVMKKARRAIAEQQVPGFRKVHDRVQGTPRHTVFTAGAGKTIEHAQLYIGGVQLQEDADFLIDGSSIVLLKDLDGMPLRGEIQDERGLIHRI